MTTSHLDQPDNYSGNHHLVSVAYMSLDTSTYTGHLLMWHPGAPNGIPSYCGRKNPCKVIRLKKLLKHHCAPTIGHIARVVDWGSYNGHDVTICPDCLSMALCQAEMLGQRAYPIKTIMREMDALPGKHTPAKK